MSYSHNYRAPSPNYRARSPEYRPQSPEYRPRSPDYRPGSPDYRPRSPNYRPRISVYMPRVRNYWSRSPDYRTPSPEYRPPSPDYRPPERRGFPFYGAPSERGRRSAAPEVVTLDTGDTEEVTVVEPVSLSCTPASGCSSDPVDLTDTPAPQDSLQDGLLQVKN